MKTIHLQCKDRSDLHDWFEKELSAPYGRNLDALHDRLSTMREELTLVLDETALCAALGDRYYENFLKMLRDTQQENPKLNIEIR